MYKLFNFPTVNVITIPECVDRIELLKNKFNEYGVTNINVNTYKKYEDGDYNFEGEYCNNLTNCHRGVLSSHLLSIKKWIETSNDDHAIFCEDDLSLDTVQYWSFDWSSFFCALPKNWGCIQLVLVKEQMMSDRDLSFRQRDWDDWSSCCFMIKKSFGKKLINAYYQQNIFTLNYRGIDEHKRKTSENGHCWLIPTNENILYSLLEPVYVVPLFVENIDFSTTNNLFTSKENEIHQSLGHVESHLKIIDWWKSCGLNLNVVKNHPEVFG